ncbi:MAG TPA: MFS transporter [Streptosporangiaceae bacterium]|jgi:MFS family permease
MGHATPAGTDRAAPPSPSRPALHARTAVYVVFGLNGAAFSNWMARVPAVRDALHFTPGRIGLLLLAVSVASVATMPLTGMVVNRIGPRATIAAGAVIMCAGLATAGIGAQALVSVPIVAVGLFALGVGNSGWDVAMNVAGADVEQRLSRSIMPRFHAAFSLGTVAGAGLGALGAAWHVPLSAHLAAVAVVVLAATLVAVRWVLPTLDTHTAADAAGGATPVKRPHPLAVWLEPRTLAVGFFVMMLALTEGSANDWLALATVDGYHASQATGAIGFAVFVAAMTIGRVSGTALLDRFGRVAVLRVTIGLAVAGLLVFLSGASLVTAMGGALLWGLGASLGFPVGMSAAADDPARAAARVSAVASIGYLAFLAGPPVIGFLGDHVGTLHSLVAVLVALMIGLVLVSAVRPPGAKR